MVRAVAVSDGVPWVGFETEGGLDRGDGVEAEMPRVQRPVLRRRAVDVVATRVRTLIRRERYELRCPFALIRRNSITRSLLKQ